MASVIIPIERDADRPSPGSLGALAVGRHLADAAGATLYALCCLSEDDSVERWADALGAAGADRIAAARWAGAEEPALWDSHGPVISEICGRLAPRLVLVPASSTGDDIAPRLAARLGAAYLPGAGLERGPEGQVVLSRALPGATHRLRHRLTGTGVSCVATIAAPAPGAPLGDADVDIVFFDVDPPAAHFCCLEADPDPDAALERARVVVTAGRAVGGPAELALVTDLARALGGELAGTRGACDRGHVPPSRVVGIDGRRVAPELYVAVGASGSLAHLGAVSPDAEIVAINRDPDAPIFAVASYGLIGNLGEVIPALLAELSP